MIKETPIIFSKSVVGKVGCTLPAIDVPELKLSDYLSVLKNGGAKLYASKMSANSRGIKNEQLESLGFTPATPKMLVSITFESDKILIY